MPSFPDPENNRADKIDFIVAHRHGTAFKTIKMLGPLISRRPGQQLPDTTAASALERELSAMPDEQLEAEYQDARRAVAQAEEERFKQEAEKRAREEARLPINWPGDVAYWAKSPYWTIEEAVALVLGREPKYANRKSVQTYLQVSPGAQLYLRTLELAERNVSWNQLTNPTAPGAFLVWAKRYGIAVPAGLEAEVAKYDHYIGDWRTLYESAKAKLDAALERERQLAKLTSTVEGQLATLQAQLQATVAELSQRQPAPKEPDPREITSLRKLCIGMAIRGYRFSPGESRNSATSDIVGDLDLLGITVSADTVRKHLAAGAELLPQDWKARRDGDGTE